MSCPDCAMGGLIPGEPTGITGLQNAYYAAAPSGPGTSKRAVLVLTDVFGLYNNPKIIADKLSVQLDCDVWVPDYFNGDPILRPERMKAVPPPARTTNFWLAWLNFALVILPRLFVYYRNRPSVCHARLREVHQIQLFLYIYMLIMYRNSSSSNCRKRKNMRKSEQLGKMLSRSVLYVLLTVSNNRYCYGGTQAVLMAPTGLVHSTVVCHPGTITLDQVKAINIPSSWVLAEGRTVFFRTYNHLTDPFFRGYYLLRQGTRSSRSYICQ